MTKITSLQKRLNQFKKHPKKATWVEKWFFGWRFFHGALTQWSINVIGDKIFSWWYRVSGVLFIIFSIFFLIGLRFIWALFFIQ